MCVLFVPPSVTRRATSLAAPSCLLSPLVLLRSDVTVDGSRLLKQHPPPPSLCRRHRCVPPPVTPTHGALQGRHACLYRVSLCARAPMCRGEVHHTLPPCRPPCSFVVAYRSIVTFPLTSASVTLVAAAGAAVVSLAVRAILLNCSLRRSRHRSRRTSQLVRRSRIWVLLESSTRLAVR